MIGKPFAPRAKHLVIAAVGALVGGSLMTGASAFAQQPDEITVMAPRVVQQRPAGMHGVPPETVTLSRAVGYGDLDLTSDAGAAALEQRVKDTAKQVCGELYVLYPDSQYLPNPENQDCVMVAVDAGLAQAKAVTAAVRRIAFPPGELTVFAPRVLQLRAAGMHGEPPETVMLSHRVAYGDLDLATPAGASALEARVKDAAKMVCGQLYALYPDSQYLPNPENQDCVMVAVDGGMAQAKAVIAAARK